MGLPGILSIGAPASSSPVKGYDDDVQSGEEEEEEEERSPCWCKGFAKGGGWKIPVHNGRIVGSAVIVSFI